MATRREARGGTLVLGGGLAGAYVARLLGRHGATVVNRENVMLYTPLLPEAASGTLEPRHVVVPLRQMCPHAELLVGEAARLDEAARSVEIETHAGTQVVRWQRLSAAPGRAAALGAGGGRADDPARDPAPARLLGAAGARPPGCRATPERVDPPTCQHALRQARRLVRSLAGEEGTYRNRMLGQVATLGRLDE